MINRVIITKYNNKLLLARFKDDCLDYISFFDEEEDSLGTVYLCRVTKVLNNINGAFIQYKKGINGFVKGDSFKQEQIIALQLKKEGTVNKEPLFTDSITLSSPYAIVSRGSGHVNVSSKLSDEERTHYTELLADLSCKLKLNIIVRTNSVSVSDNIIKETVIRLNDDLEHIEHCKECRTLYSVLYKPQKSYIKEILDFNPETYSEIVTDIPYIYDELNEIFPTQGKDNLIDNNGNTKYENNDYKELKNNFDIRLYNDELLSLFHLNRMGHHIQNLTKTVIPLKSGAEIVINNTEALTAIDVNTHNTKSQKDTETTFFETNKEAACEIARQLKLRNISGMIIIDFINMKQQKHYEELFEYINELCAMDPIGLKAIDITGLKLVELVRTKRRKSLAEQMR